MGDFGKTIVVIVIVLAVLFCGFAWIPQAIDNMISYDEALTRFAEIAEVPEEEIEVVHFSNNSFFFGDPNDVTFELRIRGKPVSGRCTSGDFSPMVCRLYEGE